MFDKFKKMLESEPGPKKMKPLHFFIILFGLGIAFVIFTDFLSVTPEPTQEFGIGPPASTGADTSVIGESVSNDTVREYESRYETQLAEMLEKVVGVGQVEVMVNLDSTPEVVVEKNRDIRSQNTQETDKDKATRNQSEQSRNEEIVVVQGAKQEQPIVLKTLKPKVRGVLIVAKGAENLQVKAWILEAVQRVLDVPAYKISILPKKG